MEAFDSQRMKYTIEQPSVFLPKTLTDEIRKASFEAEHQRNLHDIQLNIIYHQNWFNMYVPKAYGGLELSLPDILKIEECLGWADGSTGWVVTLCSGAAWFIGFLDPELIKAVFVNGRVCFAGSGAVTGTANKTSDGYVINGYWKYATGSLHATVFTINCHVREAGRPLYSADGTPVVNSFLLKKNEVTIHPTWNSMGMVATGSHAIEVKHLLVPLHRSFIIDAAHAKLENPIFKYPFLQLAETTLAVNLSGMAYRFLDLCADLFSAKAENSFQNAKHVLRKLADIQEKLDEYRYAFYAHADEAWNALISQNSIPDSILEAISNASHILAHRSRELVNDLYPFCGLTAADTRNEINRVWRNIHTAGQHSLFTRRNSM